MSVVYFMRGAPASGKSTLARRVAQEYGATTLSKDALRRWLCPDVPYEQCDLHYIERMRDVILHGLLKENKDVVLDETFIEVADISHAIQIALDHGAELVLVDLTDVPFDVLYDRDAARPNRVGFNALMSAWGRIETERDAFDEEIRPLFDVVLTFD